MFAAAGMVVTEMSTPIRAPDFADVSERIPAIPATKATKNEKKSGFEMNPVSGWLSGTKSSGDTPSARNSEHARGTSGRTPTGKPTASAAQRATREVGAALDERHAEPGERAELGPDHHRSHDQDRLVEQDAHRARSAWRAP